jgi:opacity protein-like surface antigen
MRRILVAAALTVGVAQGAFAADLPVLRGGYIDDYARPVVVDWQGVYIGGQGGWGSTDIKPEANINNDLAAAFAAQNGLPPAGFGPPGSSHRTDSGYGAFIGYNTQWDDVVIGLEGNYFNGKFGSVSYWESTAAGVTSFSSVAMTVKDFGTLRARAGYVWGAFLPYAFGGVALGRADVVRTVGVNDPTVPGVIATQNDRFIYGYTAGLGVDVSLYAGLFLRAEWEYIRFTSAIDTNINTVRAGLGYKF